MITYGGPSVSYDPYTNLSLYIGVIPKFISSRLRQRPIIKTMKITSEQRSRWESGIDEWISVATQRSTCVDHDAGDTGASELWTWVVQGGLDGAGEEINMDGSMDIVMENLEEDDGFNVRHSCI